MKNLLLLLILANILYFMWGMFATEDPRPGVAVVEESDLGPPLDVKAGANDDTGAGDAELGSGQLSDLEAVVGRSCVTIGPFKAVGDADTAVLEYTGEGMKAVRRRGVAQVFIGHSVQVENVASRAAGREMIGKLAEQGLSDAFIEKVELQARAAGYEVEISPMMRDADVFFVDIGLPPGRGAGSIIEHYGEDLVALRDAATCPH